jgi:ABC-type antimicrobial peptide transport system permease subunit
MEMVAFFAATALLLAGLGIYGTISYVVNEQRREIAIRLALGAQRGTILKMVLRRGLGLAAAGAGLGVAGALIVSHLMAGCSTACRLPICPPSLASPLYLPLSRSPPAISRRCAPCASIQSRHSTPNDFLALLEKLHVSNPSVPETDQTYIQLRSALPFPVSVAFSVSL